MPAALHHLRAQRRDPLHGGEKGRPAREFDRQKVLEGLLEGCEKRPVPMAKLAEVVDAVESTLADNPEREMSTAEVGEMLMERLRSWIRSPMCGLRRFTGTSRMWRRSWWS